MKWIKKHWTDTLLFSWASIWTAGGMYMAVNIAVNLDTTKLYSAEVLEGVVFLNVAAVAVYLGFSTQLGLVREWKKSGETLQTEKKKEASEALSSRSLISSNFMKK